MIIKYIRDNLNLTQEEFAKKVGVSFSTVNRWENNKAKPNKLAYDSIFNLAKENNLDISKFVYERIDEEVKKINLSSSRRILFHGSKSKILGDIMPKSSIYCDFGKGFYMGTNKMQPLTLISDFEDSTFYIVSIKDANLNLAYIPADIRWALIVAKNRGLLEKYIDTPLYKSISKIMDSYDLIIGDIADDRMFYVLQRFFNGSITDATLVNSLKALDLGKQVVAISEKACKNVRIEKEIKLSYLEKLAIKDISLGNRNKGIELANEICKTYRREGQYFDELLESIKEVKI